MNEPLVCEGPDLDELIDSIRGEHGEAASILYQDSVRRGGVMGFFAQEVHRVVYRIGDPGQPAGTTGDADDHPFQALLADAARLKQQDIDLETAMQSSTMRQPDPSRARAAYAEPVTSAADLGDADWIESLLVSADDDQPDASEAVAPRAVAAAVAASAQTFPTATAYSFPTASPHTEAVNRKPAEKAATVREAMTEPLPFVVAEAMPVTVTEPAPAAAAPTLAVQPVTQTAQERFTELLRTMAEVPLDAPTPATETALPATDTEAELLNAVGPTETDAASARGRHTAAEAEPAPSAFIIDEAPVLALVENDGLTENHEARVVEAHVVEGHLVEAHVVEGHLVEAHVVEAEIIEAEIVAESHAAAPTLSLAPAEPALDLDHHRVQDSAPMSTTADFVRENAQVVNLPASGTPDARARLDLAMRLREVGVPAGINPSDDVTNVYEAIDAILSDLAPAPTAPRQPGDVLVIIGEAAPALRAAQSVARSLRLRDSQIWVADLESHPAIELAGGDARENSISNARHAARVRAELDSADVASVIVLATDGTDSDPDDPWISEMLEALRPTAVWACVDATRKAGDTAARLGLLGDIDALVVHSAAISTSPASVWEIGIPVTLLDSRPATVSTWAGLLLALLSRPNTPSAEAKIEPSPVLEAAPARARHRSA